MVLVIRPARVERLEDKRTRRHTLTILTTVLLENSTLACARVRMCTWNGIG
jgi:hypothetical protein